MANRHKDEGWLEGDALVEAIKRELGGYEVDPNEPPRHPPYTLRIPYLTRRRKARPNPRRKEPPPGQGTLW